MNNAEKIIIFIKFNIPLWLKKKIVKIRDIFKTYKVIYLKPGSNIIFNGEILKEFSLKAETGQRSSIILLFNLILQMTARVVRQEREIKV